MIIVRLKGGLGNQMFQYALGRQLAEKNQTDLRLDLSFYDDQSGITPRQYELAIFKIRAEIAKKEDVVKVIGPRPPRLVQKILDRLKIDYNKKNYVREDSFGFRSYFLSLPDNVYLDGYFQSEKYFSDIRTEILADFSLLPGEADKIVGLSQKIKTANSVSLHVRRGDYVSRPEANAFHGICSLDYYRAAIKIIKDRISEPHFFIFSDDLDWCRDNFSDLEKVEFVSGFSPAQDLILMSRCRHNIIANSSFSWWGAWLNQNTKNIVIAPQRWFSDQTIDISDRLPAAWLKI